MRFAPATALIRLPLSVSNATNIEPKGCPKRSKWSQQGSNMSKRASTDAIQIDAEQKIKNGHKHLVKSVARASTFGNLFW